MDLSWCCHVEAWNRLSVDSYDDLLLPGHRLFAQLPVFASGERFKNYFLGYIPSYCSTVYLPTNCKVRYEITIGKFTVLEQTPSISAELVHISVFKILS